MNYRDILNTAQKINKEKVQSVFSDVIGETNELGKLADFLKETNTNISSILDEPIAPSDDKLKKEITVLLSKFQNQTKHNIHWITIMGLLERKILQLRLYRNVQISYSTQLQKSGDNKYNYILLRAPFVDIYTGRKEVRVYHNKLEDYGTSTIDELKERKDFKNDAVQVVRKEMDILMEKEGITMEYIIQQIDLLDNQRKKDFSKHTYS